MFFKIVIKADFFLPNGGGKKRNYMVSVKSPRKSDCFQNCDERRNSLPRWRKEKNNVVFSPQLNLSKEYSIICSFNSIHSSYFPFRMFNYLMTGIWERNISLWMSCVMKTHNMKSTINRPLGVIETNNVNCTINRSLGSCNTHCYFPHGLQSRRQNLLLKKHLSVAYTC